MNKTEKFWDRIANQFDKQAGHFEKPPVERSKKYMNAADVVLDYGCATGTTAIEIAANVKKIYCIDISSRMIDAAKRKADEFGIKNIDFVKSEIFDDRFKKESFDVILAYNILHLLEDPVSNLQRINELLKPGGLIISVTACMGEKTLLRLLLFLLMKTGLVPNMKFFKTTDLEESISDANFQIVEKESLNNSPQEHFIVAKKK